MDWGGVWHRVVGIGAFVVCVGAVVQAVRDPSLVNVGLIAFAVAVAIIWTVWERWLDEPRA